MEERSWRGEAVVIDVAGARTLDAEFAQIIVASVSMQESVGKQETCAIGSASVGKQELPDNRRRRQGIKFPMKL